TGLFGHPARPAVEGHPAMKVTRPMKISAIDALNAPAPVPTAEAPVETAQAFRGAGAGSDWSGQDQTPVSTGRTRTKKEKADLANAIANSNPSLTREQILDIV